MRTSPPPPSEMTCGFLIQLVFCKKKTTWFIGVEVEQETSAPPPQKNPGSAPDFTVVCSLPWPLNRGEARGDLVLLQAFLLFKCKSWYSHANKPVNMIIYI